jgi:glycerophosphoryl diester phosphodiesterase
MTDRDTAANDWSKFKIIAHRGASAVAPENTLIAIAKAAELGARSVELDVMLSSDGVPIIIHDTALDRTTNGTGPVAAQSYEALARRDAGTWFGDAFAGEKIPTLSDAIDLILDRKMALNLEIKPSPGEDRATARSAIEHLAGKWHDPTTLVLSSSSMGSLEVARDTARQWRRGLIVDVPPPHWRDVMANLQCASVHCAASAATPSLVEEIHAAGLKILTWTVNRPAQAATLFKNGVDGIFTDDPATMIAKFGG